ncbi:hypothetical protein D8Y20_00760 [Mariprofundus sp. EBB-1]|uniref:PAS domain-containing protein n=1 Tax=Mariprofundus sp. EBB-1 TaxID=2650971 RepID=UPI000EF202A1|nr:PAS domain-containing protein [Mariprofundus sp. EBB-1]RLL56004.1 hypothetical protein D8Y20_00760 [Mariprofundus sp. EBB-1]
MGKEEDNNIPSAELRRRAESRLAELRDEQVDAALPEDTQALIHELRTHQIELEMQNEALRQTEAELTEAHHLYFDLYNFAPVGYATINAKGLISQANLTLANQLDVERASLFNQPFAQFVTDPRVFGNYLHQCLRSKERVTAELDLKLRSGGQLIAQLTGYAIDNESGAGTIRVAIVDISMRKLGEQSLEQVQKLLANEEKHVPAELRQTLQHSIHQMRTYSKLNIDRELRMIELKKEINALNKELGRDDKYVVYSVPKDLQDG